MIFAQLTSHLMIKVNVRRLTSTYQTNEDTEKLDHISVGHRVQSSNQGVKYSDEGGDDHGYLYVDVHDDAQRRP